MAHYALTLERTCGYISGSYADPTAPEGDPAGDAATVVGHGILGDSMLYLTARRAEDGMLFRVLLNPGDLRRL